MDPSRDQSRDQTRASRRYYVPSEQPDDTGIGYNVPSGKSDDTGADLGASTDENTKILSQTIPQREQYVTQLREAMESGKIAKGNVELAALLGFKPAIQVLGREDKVKPMNSGELIKFLLTDPHLKITIDVA
jgi:hypothetical protein